GDVRAVVENRVPAPWPRETARPGKVRRERIRLPRCKAGHRGWNDPVAGQVTVVSSERRSVERVLDGTAHPDVAKERTSSVQHDAVPTGDRLVEIALIPGSRSRAAGAVAPVERAGSAEQGILLEVRR